MSSPDIIFNPETGRYVKATGRKGKNLARRGVVAPRFTVKAPKTVHFALAPPAPRFAAFAAPPPPRFAAPPPPRAAAFALPPRIATVAPGGPCGPGKERNPLTGRCVKHGSRVFNQLVKAFGPPPSAPPPPPSTFYPVHRAAAAAAPALTEPSPRLGARKTGVAPLVDRGSVLGWASTNCHNSADPLTGIPFTHAEPAALQELVRLHNGTCTFATPLDSHVAAQHKRGTLATLPDDPSGHMTLEDFTALRDAMRRHTPGYKIPGRKHQRPPATWQLYVASDERSGPDFVTVAYVDTMKGVMRADGPHYPESAIVIDLGFLPADFSGSCTGPMMMSTIQRLDTAGKLLTPIAGGWKASAGFPFSKRHWEHDKKRKLDRFCLDLSALLAAI
jgi:hypothetical protein